AHHPATGLGLRGDQHHPRLQELPERLRHHRRAHQRRSRHGDEVCRHDDHRRLQLRGLLLPDGDGHALLHRLRDPRRPPTLPPARMERVLRAMPLIRYDGTGVDQSATDSQKPPESRSKPGRYTKTGTIVLILCALTVLLPLYVTVSMAFKSGTQAVDGNAFSLPNPFSVDSFVQAWTLTDAPVGFAISVFITACTVALTILIASFASYAIIRNWDRRLFKYSFFYLLGAMFIPFPVVALPQIQL